MHNFRKNPRLPNRRMDGLLHTAPGRQQRDQWPVSAQAPGRSTAVKPGSIDDFKRSEGFHPTDRSDADLGTPLQKGKQQEAKGKDRASILHMTLPGGVFGGGKKEGRAVNKKKTRWFLFRKWGLRSSLIVAGFVLLIGGFLLLKGYLNIHKVFQGGGNAAALQENVSPSQLKGEGDGRINVLLLGRGGEGHAGADLTDTILLASIDPVNKSAVLLSVPRDFWVTVQGLGSSKINAVYVNAKNKALRNDSKDKAKAENAGLKALRETISSTFGIPIHYDIMVDFNAFKQAVEVVGGVDINVPADLAVSENLWDNTTGKNYSLKVPAGQQHFDSTKALYFTRSRHTSKRGDFDRTERQRLFITALSQKILSAGTYTNPVKVSQLLDTFGSHVSTDFSVGDAVRFMQITKEISTSNIVSIGLADEPNVLVQTGNINGQSVVVAKAGISSFGPIQQFIRSKLQDGYILKEAANVHVLNGTPKAGLATTKAEELKTYGYKVTTVGDAPAKNYTKNVVVDLTGGKKPYTKNYLERRFGVTAVDKLPDTTIQATGADFVIILGE